MHSALDLPTCLSCHVGMVLTQEKVTQIRWLAIVAHLLMLHGFSVSNQRMQWRVAMTMRTKSPIRSLSVFKRRSLLLNHKFILRRDKRESSMYARSIDTLGWQSEEASSSCVSCEGHQCYQGCVHHAGTLRIAEGTPLRLPQLVSQCTRPRTSLSWFRDLHFDRNRQVGQSFDR